MLWKKKKEEGPALDFDKTGKKPVIRTSICTGEQVAGFRDESGHGPCRPCPQPVYWVNGLKLQIGFP